MENSNYLGRKHHEAPLYIPSTSPLSCNSNSLSFAYLEFTPSSSATAIAGIQALAKHVSKAFKNSSSGIIFSFGISSLICSYNSVYIKVSSLATDNARFICNALRITYMQ